MARIGESRRWELLVRHSTCALIRLGALSAGVVMTLTMGQPYRQASLSYMVAAADPGRSARATSDRLSRAEVPSRCVRPSGRKIAGVPERAPDFAGRAFAKAA
jgi:hypothetical protein